MHPRRNNRTRRLVSLVVTLLVLGGACFAAFDPLARKARVASYSGVITVFADRP